MSQRIRYTKPVESMCRSVKVFQHPTNGESYYIQLDSTKNEYKIFENTTALQIKHGAACNFHQVKIRAKKDLESLLGISFEVEDRLKRLA